MIDRYTRPEIGAIWTDQGKYDSWLKVELAVVDAWAKRGVIPEDDRAAIHSGAAYDISRIDEIEAVTHHDVIAFLTSVAEHVGPSSRWVHLGMTSSDMLDTALALQLKAAGKILIDGLDPLLESLKEKALKYKDLPSIGRTHGVHAEPVAFGLRFARFHEQLARAKERLIQSYEWVCTGKLSGAVGMYVHLDPEMEEEVMEALELNVAPISSQIVSRDRHADFMAAISLIASNLESIALEVRHLQRTEVREVREGFAKGQKGSSAMPHKRNPINAEKICGMARLLRSNMHAAFENIALWHERDISHSSVERVILPDSTIGLDYLLNLTNRLVKNLVVDEQRVQEVLGLTNGAVFSEGLLLALVRSGLTREEGYAMVQRIAHAAVDAGASVKEAALNDKELVEKIGSEEVERAFDVKHALRHTEAIYKRIGFIK
ncbi:MAG TPA: adenylosuccinate lyase [Bacteroidetes bacterium]|nr:adenylosuccinate lyase [bacterium BMS3Bbin04]HDO64471.1 adenylosuccinate lyase [Bacteroidota bacterium]HEX03596.1 adenylosuccinate lyase [Bacteroidota bacterium]